MPYPLTLLPIEEFERRRLAGELQPGDAHYAPWLKKPQHTSQHYWDDWADTRDPIVVKLPGGGWWNIDQKGTHTTGWHITGTVPALTASPSVLDDRYHGFLVNGVFSDDIEGRHYDNEGKVL